MLDLLVLVLAAFVVYFFIVLRPTGLVTANSLFLYIQMIMASGTFLMLENGVEADVVYGYIVAWAMLSYMVVSAIATLRQPSAPRLTREWEPGWPRVRTFHPRAAVGALIALSVLILALYFQAIGYSALIQGLSNSLTGGDADVAGQRLASYAGSQYFFPGYVNQFKNSLLPALTVIVFTYWTRTGRRHPLTMVVLAGITLFGLLGTGQRGAFIQFMAVIVVFLYLVNGRRFPQGTFKVVIVGLFFIVASTIALGRSNASLSRDASLIDRSVTAIGEFAGRVFKDQQASAVAGFRYIYEQPVQWGREWAQGMTGILPGSPGSDLSSRIYAGLYGSDRGTAPPSIWGSLYHNFGWVGVAVLPALLALVFVGVSRKATTPRERNTLELIGIAGVFTTIGFWAAGSPETLLNTGLVVYAFLWSWGTSSVPATVNLSLPSHASRHRKKTHKERGPRLRGVLGRQRTVNQRQE